MFCIKKVLLHIDACCKCCLSEALIRTSSDLLACFSASTLRTPYDDAWLLELPTLRHGVRANRDSARRHIETDDFTSRIPAQQLWHKQIDTNYIIELASPKVWHRRPPMTSPNLDYPDISWRKSMVIAIATCSLAVSSSWVIRWWPSPCWFLEMLRVVSFTGEHIFEAGSETLGVDSLDMWRLDVGWVIGHWKVTLELDFQVFSYFCKLLSSVYWIECIMLGTKNVLFNVYLLDLLPLQLQVCWRIGNREFGIVCEGASAKAEAGGSESWGLQSHLCSIVKWLVDHTQNKFQVTQHNVIYCNIMYDSDHVFCNLMVTCEHVMPCKPHQCQSSSTSGINACEEYLDLLSAPALPWPHHCRWRDVGRLGSTWGISSESDESRVFFASRGNCGRWLGKIWCVLAGDPDYVCSLCQWLRRWAYACSNGGKWRHGTTGKGH